MFFFQGNSFKNHIIKIRTGDLEVSCSSPASIVVLAVLSLLGGVTFTAIALRLQDAPTSGAKSAATPVVANGPLGPLAELAVQH